MRRFLLLSVLTACGPMRTEVTTLTSEGELLIDAAELSVHGRAGDVRVVHAVDAPHVVAEAAMSWRGDFVPAAQLGVEGARVVLSDTCPPRSLTCAVAWDVDAPPVETSLETETGNVAVIGALGPVRIRVGSGLVSAEGSVGTFTAEVDVGHVTATSLDVENVTVNVGTGDVGVDVDHDGPVSAEVAVGSGAVALDLAGTVLGARVNVGTGDVTLTLPAGSFNFVLSAPGSTPTLPPGLVHDPSGGNVEVAVGTGTITLIAR